MKLIRRIFLISAMFMFAGEAAAQWHVKAATVRFKVSPDRQPSHDSCGYFVKLPDGGILPGPAPVVTAVDSSGTPVKCASLWYNKGTGLGVVYGKPSDGGSVYLYVQGGESLNAWTPATGLTPSGLLCQNYGQNKAEAAQALARSGPVPPTVHYAFRTGGKGATVSIGADLLARSGPVSSYLKLYLNVTDPGKIWVAPKTWRGSTKVVIDGQLIQPTKLNGKDGGTGQHIQLSKGLHRCDIFHNTDNGGAGGNGMMTLLWRTPNTTEKQLGGKRPDDLRYPGTPMWEARHLSGNEVAKSGSGSITEVKAQDGSPVAYARYSAERNYWFGGESPVFIYKLAAFTAGNPESTTYIWSFGNESRKIAKETEWFFKGRGLVSFTLTATDGDKRSQSKVFFVPFTTRKTDLNDWGARKAFRDTAYEVFTSYPEGVDPTADWDKSLWNNFFRCIELGHGAPLLVHIFTKRWDILKNKLPYERRYLLEDQFVHYISRRDPEKASYWIAKQIQDEETDEYRKKEFTVKLAELYMYYLDDLDKAREILTPLTEDSEPVNELAKIRYGDIELLARDINKASAMYGNVQDRVNLHKRKERLRRPPPKEPEPTKHTFKPLKSRLGSGKSDINRKNSSIKRSNSTKPVQPLAPGDKVDKWKLSAILETSSSETVKTYMDQRFYQEAKNALDAWELNFPLSKIQSDFITQEAELLLVFKDYKRARKMLEAYCDQVDASNFIAPAVEMLMDCMLQMKEPKSKLLERCEKMKKRLEFHPAAKQIEEIMNVLKGGGGGRQKTYDKIEDFE